MKNRKDIGEAFREKLDHLDKSPSEKVWAAIHADLQKKKKRRAIFIPFWLKIAGVFTLGVAFSLLVFNGPLKNGMFSKPATEKKKKMDSEGHGHKNLNNKPHPNISNPAAADEHSAFGAAAKKTGLASGHSGASMNTNADAAGAKPENNERIKKNKDNNSFERHQQKYASEEVILKGKRSAKKHSKQLKSGNTVTASGINAKGKDSLGLSGRNQVTDANPVTDGTNGSIASEKAAAKEGPAFTVTDSIKNKAKTTLKEPSKEEKDSTKTVEITRINLFVYGAPTYSGTFSKISAIDKRLASNPQSSALSWSYGAYAMYEATSAWSLRFGISKTTLKLVTRDAAVDTPDYSNIGYKNMSNAIMYSQSGNAEKMDITQEITYTEIPLELKYAISKKKIGINVYGGISYMFLDKNIVKAETSNGQTFKVGETKNLSGNTYSANFGIGLDYKFSRRLRFNLEPVFKYHLKDYKNVGPINPYTIGILTGLQFSLHK